MSLDKSDPRWTTAYWIGLVTGLVIGFALFRFAYIVPEAWEEDKANYSISPSDPGTDPERATPSQNPESEVVAQPVRSTPGPSL